MMTPCWLHEQVHRVCISTCASDTTLQDDKISIPVHCLQHPFPTFTEMNNFNGSGPVLDPGLFDPLPISSSKTNRIGNNNKMLSKQGQQQVLTFPATGTLNSLSAEETKLNENTINRLEELLLQGRLNDFETDSQSALNPTPLDPSIGGSVGLGDSAGSKSSRLSTPTMLSQIIKEPIPSSQPTGLGPELFSNSSLRDDFDRNNVRLTSENENRLLTAGLNGLKSANLVESTKQNSNNIQKRNKLNKQLLQFSVLSNSPLSKSLDNFVSMGNGLHGKSMNLQQKRAAPFSSPMLNNGATKSDSMKKELCFLDNQTSHMPSSSSVDVMDSIQDSEKRNDVNSLLLQPFSNEVSTPSRDQEDHRKQKGPGGSFPKQVFQMLSDLETQEGGTDIASFLAHGRAFSIHKPKEFVEKVMPTYFRMSQFASFQRQLNLYGFRRIKEGPDKGAYFHELFVQGQNLLCAKIRRKKTKQIRSRDSDLLSFDNFEGPF